MGTFFIISGLVLLFFALSVREVPAHPPHFAVVTLFGKRLPVVKEEGYRLFPFYPVISGAVLIEATKRNENFPPHSVRTRDRAELKISVSATWSPNPEYGIEYLNHGGESGVRDVLTELVREQLRQYTIKNPWRDTLGVKNEVAAQIIDEILRDARTTNGSLTDRVSRLRRGNAAESVPWLGILLHRLNVGEVEVLGELHAAAELAAIEREVSDVVKMMMSMLEISKEAAIELVQIDRSKVAKRIKEIRPSLTEQTVNLLVDAIGRGKS